MKEKQMTTTNTQKPAATKATPKAKAAAKATTPKAPVEKKMFTVTGRSGQAVFRQFAATMTHAIDVADPKATKPLAKAGQIWAFYANAEKAEAAAGKLRAKGFDVLVTADVKVAAKAVAA
jgi:hypothetical protein